MSVTGFGWTMPFLLLLLPLALLPWLNQNHDKKVAWVRLVPVDPLSKAISFLLRALASLTIVGLIVALAGPFVPEQLVDRYGQGAEVVILVDRSRSMDDPFAVVHQAAMRSPHGDDSRRRVSKDYLTEFVKRRPDDRFGYVFFSANSQELLPLTYSRDAILATIEAGSLGRGLSDTNIGNALIEAAEMFEREVYRGSRIVLLISDGGAVIPKEEQAYITELYRQNNLTLYWIFLRPMMSMTLEPGENDNLLWVDTVERRLHEFFQGLAMPYRAFEAGSMEDFANAIDEIDSQQYQTLVVQDTLPRQPRADLFLWLAMLALLLLSASQLYTLWGVRKAHE